MSVVLSVELSVVLLGLMAVISGQPAMAASRCLGSNYVIDMRAAGSILIPDSGQSFAAYATFQAMINNGVVDYNGSWKENEYDLDQDGTKDLMLELTSKNSQDVYIFTALSENTINGEITVQINSETKDALLTDGYDYYEKLTFRFPDALPVLITGASVSGIVDKEYTGMAQTQSVTVKMADLVLQEGTHYKVAYQNNTNVGTAAITISGMGTCTGTITKYFKITEKAADTVTVGKIYTISKMRYKVTNADMTGKGIVTLTGTTVKKTKLKRLTIPSKVKINGVSFRVTVIADKAFQNYKKLGTVTIGKNIMAIGKNAFAGDKKLKKIKIRSAKLKSVGKKAVNGIQKNAVITVPKKQIKVYKKLFSSKTGFKKPMTVK